MRKVTLTPRVEELLRKEFWMLIGKHRLLPDIDGGYVFGQKEYDFVKEQMSIWEREPSSTSNWSRKADYSLLLELLVLVYSDEYGKEGE